MLAGGTVWWLLSHGEGDSLTQQQTLAEADAANGALADDSATEASADLVLVSSQYQAEQDALREVYDPVSDGWQTEDLADTAGQRLSEIAKAMESWPQVESHRISAVVSEQFSCPPLRSTELQAAFDDQGLLVSRVATAAEQPQAIIYRGSEGAIEAVGQMLEIFPLDLHLHVKFKVIRIESSGEHLLTTVYYQAAGHHSGGSVQQNATWDCSWIRETEAGSLRLLSIEVSDYEQVDLASQTTTLFNDCSQSVLGDLSAYRDQLRHGNLYWLDQIGLELSPYLLEAHHGVAIGDVNGDGLDDVYICQPAGMPNLLLVAEADGTVSDRSSWSGLDVMDCSSSALLLDFDNDSDQDVAILTQAGGLLFFSNDGQGRFELRRQIPADLEYALAAADYDQDGDLDIYVCNYQPEAIQEHTFGRPVPYYDANNGGANALFRNDGDWNFTDVTRETGLDKNNQRWSYAASWDDFDNDGDLDLYVSNDFGRNSLYRNDNGRFLDIAPESHVEDIASGMSASWADYNQDGWMDIYVSNMFSSAGGRITFQSQFAPQVSRAARSYLQRLARGNTLFENAGDGSFSDVTEAAGVTMGRWAWGSNFVDFNNDSREDLLVANGFLTMSATSDL